MAAIVINQGSATLSIPLTSGGQPVTTGAVSVSLYDPNGQVLLQDFPLAHQGAGVYSALVPAATFDTPGEHTVVYRSSFAGNEETTRLTLYVLDTRSHDALSNQIASLEIT